MSRMFLLRSFHRKVKMVKFLKLGKRNVRSLQLFMHKTHISLLRNVWGKVRTTGNHLIIQHSVNRFWWQVPLLEILVTIKHHLVLKKQLVTILWLNFSQLKIAYGLCTNILKVVLIITWPLANGGRHRSWDTWRRSIKCRGRQWRAKWTAAMSEIE